MNKKKEVYIGVIYTISRWDLECNSIDDLICELESIKEKAPAGYTRIRVDTDTNYDDCGEITFTAYRMETDEEFDKRIAKNKKIAESKRKALKNAVVELEAKERKELQRLKDKYE